jgi:hypothetical protein
MYYVVCFYLIKSLLIIKKEPLCVPMTLLGYYVTCPTFMYNNVLLDTISQATLRILMYINYFAEMIKLLL